MDKITPDEKFGGIEGRKYMSYTFLLKNKKGGLKWN